MQQPIARHSALVDGAYCAVALAGIVASWALLFLLGPVWGLVMTGVVALFVGIVTRKRWIWPLLFETPIYLSLLAMVVFCLVRYLMR